MRKHPGTALGLLAVTALAVVAAGCAHTRESAQRAAEPVRYGAVIGLRPEKLAEYKELHANAWPGVLDMIRECNIRNYSIYLAEIEQGEFYLFSYFEYIGDDFEADMAKMAADPTSQKWWTFTDPCQVPIPNAKAGERWSSIEEVFHTE